MIFKINFLKICLMFPYKQIVDKTKDCCITGVIYIYPGEYRRVLFQLYQAFILSESSSEYILKTQLYKCVSGIIHAEQHRLLFISLNPFYNKFCASLQLSVN